MAQDKDRKNLNVPPLRFPGFNDEWEIRSMQDIAPLQRGFDLPTQDVKDGNIPVVYSNGILRKHSEGKCYGPGLVTGRSGTIGKFTYIDKGEYWPHNTSLWVTDFKGNYPKFIYYLYSTIKIEQFATGSGVPTLNRNDVHRHRTFIPTVTEQKKISEFLSLLDERIATQNKIIDNLQSLIKGLAKTLTHQGEPNTRISDCLECHTSTLQEGTLNENGLYPVYGASGIVGFLDDYKCDEDSILIIKDGSGAGTVSFATGEYSVIGTLNYLIAKSGYSLKYLYFCLMSFNFEPFKTGMAIPHIYFKDYGQAKIYCPPINTQEKVARVLSSIEGKLSTEKAILYHFYQSKEYLLQKMFI